MNATAFQKAQGFLVSSTRQRQHQRDSDSSTQPFADDGNGWTFDITGSGHREGLGNSAYQSEGRPHDVWGRKNGQNRHTSEPTTEDIPDDPNGSPLGNAKAP